MTKKNEQLILAVLLGVVAVETLIIFWGLDYFVSNPEQVATFLAAKRQTPVAAASVDSEYLYDFNVPGVLSETKTIAESRSAYWWLNSGGLMKIENGVGKTIQGELPASSPWKAAYNETNPGDTDSGLHPQNIFRLVSRSKWQDVRQEAYFKINKVNLSQSFNRSDSNGIFLMSRYLDGDNLYYAGVRVDGAAIIKRKLNGQYQTLAYNKIFDGSYNRIENPNLLPKETKIGLRSEIETESNGSVSIRLYTDIGQTGEWTLVVESSNSNVSGQEILSEGYTGIRTDFMDIEFDNYRNVEI